jgi:hypothetical protein
VELDDRRFCSCGMFPFVINTRRKIFKHYTGFSFFIFIWISALETNRERLIRHEMIHFKQQVELLFLFHWILYGLFYLISRLNRQEHYIAYRYNPFELEAYGNDSNPEYLRARKAFAWVRYWAEFRMGRNKTWPDRIAKRKHAGWD